MFNQLRSIGTGVTTHSRIKCQTSYILLKEIDQEIQYRLERYVANGVVQGRRGGKRADEKDTRAQRGETKERRRRRRLLS